MSDTNQPAMQERVRIERQLRAQRYRRGECWMVEYKRPTMQLKGDAIDLATLPSFLDTLLQRNENMAECVKQIVRDEYMNEQNKMIARELTCAACGYKTWYMGDGYRLMAIPCTPDKQIYAYCKQCNELFSVRVKAKMGSEWKPIEQAMPELKTEHIVQVYVKGRNGKSYVCLASTTPYDDKTVLFYEVKTEGYADQIEGEVTHFRFLPDDAPEDL